MRLGMLDRCKVLGLLEAGYEFLEFFVREFCSVVGDDCLGNTKSNEYVAFVESHNVL